MSAQLVGTSKGDCESTTLRFEGEEYALLGTIEYARGGRIMMALNKAGERVAVKIIHKAQAFMDPTARSEIYNERGMLERVTMSRKPFLVGATACWEDRENVYFVLPLYHGTLREYAELKNANIPHSQDTLYIAELLVAVSNLHSIGIVHRDIKPENILISPTGHLGLADFGCSELWIPDNDDLAVVGTNGYIAPEVVAGTHGGADYANDIWSMGVVLYEMCMGMETSYYGDVSPECDVRVLQEDVDLTRIESVLLRDLLSKMLIRDPRERWTAEALKSHAYFTGISWDAISAEAPISYWRPRPPLVEVRRKSKRFSSFHKRWLVSANGILIDKKTCQMHVSGGANEAYQEDVSSGFGPGFSFRASDARKD